MPHLSIRVEPKPSGPPAQTAAFRCVVRDSGRDTAWIHARGELDLVGAARLKRALRDAEICRRRVLDLRKVTFMDSAGIHVIVEASDRAKRSGGRLVLVRGPSQVDRLFEQTGTLDRVETVDLNPFEPPVQALLQPIRYDGN